MIGACDSAHETMIRLSATLITYLLSMSPFACAHEPRAQWYISTVTVLRTLLDALDMHYVVARLLAMSELMYSFRSRCRCPRPPCCSSHLDAVVRPRGRRHVRKVLC